MGHSLSSKTAAQPHGGPQGESSQKGGPSAPEATAFSIDPEVFLKLLSASEAPLESVLDHLLSATGASFGLYLALSGGNGASGEILDLLGRTRHRKSILHPRRLLTGNLESALRNRRLTVRNGLDRPGEPTWQVGVFCALTLPGNQASPDGCLLFGGSKFHLAPAFTGDPHALVSYLSQAGSWCKLAWTLRQKTNSSATLSTSDASAFDPSIRAGGCLDTRFPEIIAASKAMRDILESILQIAPTDAAVLIEGESGTGKELIAKAIHQLSIRKNGPFITENCAAVPANLLESEFFGVERGAFTGASASKSGIFERSRGGTLFLDEIAEMDLVLQAKLLRVLQEREVRRVGGRETLPVDFRLISATNRKLEDEVARRRFRLDLHYRLEVVKIFVPPLRHRTEDIPLLCRHFLKMHAERLGVQAPALHLDALKLLKIYNWPGNIRELQNEIWRAVVLGYSPILPHHLSEKIRSLQAAQDSQMILPEDSNLDEAEKDILGTIIRTALRRTGGNCAEAARLLGIPRTNLYRKMARYGIKADRSLVEPLQPLSAVFARFGYFDRAGTS